METLWDNLLFWRKKPKMLKEGKDYAFIDFAESDLTGIQILDGEYKDVVYHYHQAKIVEEGMAARLKFGFTIVHSGEHDIDLLQNDEGFVTIMGDILTQILLSKAKDEQARTNNSKEFNLH